MTPRVEQSTVTVEILIRVESNPAIQIGTVTGSSPAEVSEQLALALTQAASLVGVSK